jgi:hypothetical protein
MTLAKVSDCVHASQSNFETGGFFVKSKTLTSAAGALSLIVLVASVCAFAQDRRPVHFSGLINDFSPLNATVKGSP